MRSQKILAVKIMKAFFIPIGFILFYGLSFHPAAAQEAKNYTDILDRINSLEKRVSVIEKKNQSIRDGIIVRAKLLYIEAKNVEELDKYDRNEAESKARYECARVMHGDSKFYRDFDVKLVRATIRGRAYHGVYECIQW